MLSTGTIDLLAILSASQALSSETTIEALHSRVAEVLAAMTGATAVRLLLWNDDRQDWLPPAPATDRVPRRRRQPPCRADVGAPIRQAHTRTPGRRRRH